MPGTAPFEERVRRRIRDLEEAGLRRSLQPPSGIDLSSNDYLGLANHPRLKERMAEAVPLARRREEMAAHVGELAFLFRGMQHGLSSGLLRRSQK